MKIIGGVVLCFSLSFLCAEQKRFLVFGGKTGWIGQKIVTAIQEQGHIAIPAESRLEDRRALEQEILNVHPDFIINAAGVIGRPNVDWCEDHKQDVIRYNIIGALNLADLSYLHNIHMTNVGTGCIYNYDEKHPQHSSIGFKEEEEPNFEAAFYCKTKIMLEKMFAVYPNVLNLRVRLPIASDFYRGNLIVKLTKYQKVVNIPNSITVLDDMVPLIPQMALKGLTGIYNFVNSGVIHHNELLDLYKEYIDPTFTYQNFTLEEQSKILKAARCYNELDVTKLLKEFPQVLPIKEALKVVFGRMRENKEVSND